MPRCVVGLTGLPCSGKGEVSRLLLRRAAMQGWRAEQLSFSDQIKEEARRRGIPQEDFDRELLSELAMELRAKEGPGVLAARIVRKIESWPEPTPDLFVVEALRHVAEVQTLREAFGRRFILVAVESERDLISRRLLSRRRPDESPLALRSREAAERLLEQELSGEASGLGPNVGQCMAAADARLVNNGTLQELAESVSRLFERVIPKGDCPRPSPAG